MAELFTEEQLRISDTVKKFVDKEIRPNAVQWEREERFPRELMCRMGELGFFGCVFEERYGGSNAGAVAQMLVVEQLARGTGGISTTNLVQVLAIRPIALFGSEEQKQKYLVPAISGQLSAAIAITEPNHGSNVAGIETIATKRDGGYVLNGSKMFITNGTFADFALVAAKTSPKEGRRGISLFIVEKGTPGFRVSRKLEKLGWHSSETAELIFEDCWVPESQLMGELNRGFYYIMDDFNLERLLLGAQSVGLAREALSLALDYAKQRTQFGNPIWSYQAVQHKLADMATQVEAARQLVYYGGRMMESGNTAIKEASMAKYFASEMVNRVTYDAIQIFGGYGFMREYPVERIYRDARVLTIGGGTSEVQKNIIAKQLFTY